MELPVQLAYEGSITPGDVCFFAVWPDQSKSPLRYNSRIALGLKEGAAAVYTAEGEIVKKATPDALAQGNPHQVDYCHVPYGANGVQCETSITFTSDLRKPLKCCDPGVKRTLKKLVELYESKITWNELATRYLLNICNGQWLWHNTKKAYWVNVEITPWPWEGGAVSFENVVRGYSGRASFQQHKSWVPLLQLICDAFSQPQGLAIFELKVSIKLPTNAPIRPSQEFTEKPKNSNKSDRRDNSRVYQHTLIDGDKSPIIGCYKVGAAIAMIDDWYPGAEEAVRVGHYGVHKEDVTSYRHPSTGKDFFSLLKRADEFVELLENEVKLSEETVNDLHYLIANLIKGGMFQRTGSN
ncbi:type I-F CRISPR-associated protein Csy3 [Photobacterium proteolyticum]|uniref:Type I-F CRISPR-associated protein Csy3 n=1 Tax=Photobacterium proteolyticum TaxID=1903952 RepID=A0A1Q9GF09_9GAMM|nr:type I-F CRISPR-associated protein Csy3 [Photobacterium proteolyticum]OLQ72985.1 type I-F CRISPR-associated protein Csy3 [Photobacterium proteolyticum]